MDAFYFPNESDFRRWIKEAVKECFEEIVMGGLQKAARTEEEPLLSRKEIAGIFRVSLVTLHDWMKRGLPSHKQRGRVYFLRSEVLDYLKQRRRPADKIAA